jgi:CubicO group peptidase (beta-lactamase class C family)
MPQHRLDPDALDLAFAAAARRVTTGDLPFATLGIANAAGLIRLETASARVGDTVVGPRHVCLLASITKSIVATAVMRLVQGGRFGLRTPLSDWLPELRADDRRTITAWHVMTHTTGLEEPALEPLVRDGADRADLVRLALGQRLVAPPGSRYSYSTVCWELLAAALERATGEPLDALLAELLFEPLGMVDTSFAPRADQADRLAPARLGEWDGTRHRAGEAPEVAEQLRQRYTSLRLAGGGLWSTAPDLIRFGGALLRGGELDGVRVLAPAFVDLMTREVTVDGLGRAVDRLADDRYALGWGKANVAHPGSPRAFGHGGQAGTRLWVDPEHDLVIVFLSASWDLPAHVMDESVFAVYGAIR